MDDSDGSGEPDEVEDGDDEALPTKSELEWMILQYLQPIHRYPLINKQPQIYQVAPTHQINIGSLQTCTRAWPRWRRSWGGRELWAVEKKRARVGCREKTRKKNFKSLSFDLPVVQTWMKVKSASLSLPCVVI